MLIETLVINFQGKKTEEEIYQIVLGNLNEMIIGLGDNVKLLERLKSELRDKLALTINQHYHALQAREQRKQMTYEVEKALEINHEDITALPF